MYGQYKNDELIKAAYLSGNPFTKEIVYRWKLYIRATDAAVAFVAGNISLELLEKRLSELKGVIR